MTTEKSVFIPWEKSYELGIPVIDSQHKRLVSLCNDLHEALIHGQRDDSSTVNDELARVLHECVTYIQTHFQAEEKLMIAASYENYKTHKEHHEDFVKKVLETARSVEKSSTIAGLNFVKFLRDWILSHIAHEDTLYVKPVLDYYRKSKGL